MKLGTFVLGMVLFSGLALGADPEKDAYKACFDTIDVKLDARTSAKPIEDVRKAYIEALKERNDEILGWYPDLSFQKSKALKKAFDEKGQSAELFTLFGKEYAKAMPYMLKRVNDNLTDYSKKLDASACKDPAHITVTKALDEARLTVADALILNKRIEKNLPTEVEDDLPGAITKYFKWDKPGSKLTREERLDTFITGFLTQKVEKLRGEERKNGEGLIPHRTVPPAPPDNGTHR